MLSFGLLRLSITNTFSYVYQVPYGYLTTVLTQRDGAGSGEADPGEQNTRAENYVPTSG